MSETLPTFLFFINFLIKRNFSMKNPKKYKKLNFFWQKIEKKIRNKIILLITHEGCPTHESVNNMDTDEYHKHLCDISSQIENLKINKSDLQNKIKTEPSSQVEENLWDVMIEISELHN